MHIEHRLTDYYVRYFGATPGDRYRNESKGFESCFLTFDGGARLEIMEPRPIRRRSFPRAQSAWA